MVVIKAMSALSMQPWSGRVDLSGITIIQSQGARVLLTIFSESQRLQPGHIILALYDVVLTMYNRQPGFYQLGCVILLRERKISTFYVSPGGGQVLSRSRNATIDRPEGTESLVSLVNSTRGLTDDSGVVIDRRDNRFRISWTVNGRSIPVQEIFSAVVDGLATTAQHDYTGPCSHTTGVSFSGNMGFHIGKYHDQTLRCGQISRAFELLVELVVKDQRKFQEMDFTLKYDGVNIGVGYILRISSVESRGGNLTNGIATS